MEDNQFFIFHMEVLSFIQFTYSFVEASKESNLYSEHCFFSGPDLLENDEKPGDFYSWFGDYLKTELKPKAVVIISAHWQGKGKNGIFGNIF